jgi:ribosomal RNA-processing protein 9
MTHVETLFDHQSPVVDVCCANKTRPVIARDRTVCLWKVEEDSHLVYRPGGDAGGLSASCLRGMAGLLQDTMMDG